jgi:chorismate--pyruvate lyase
MPCLYTTPWYPHYKLAGTPDNTRLCAWLRTRKSVTRQIEKQRHITLHVRMLHQGWDYPEHDEAILLGLTRKEKVWVREIHLIYAQQVFIYGRSLFTQHVRQHELNQFRQFNQRPLGYFLFSRAHLVRDPFVFAKLTPHHATYHRALHTLPLNPTHLWARCSRLTLEQQPILLTEVFLPDLLQQPQRPCRDHHDSMHNLCE